MYIVRKQQQVGMILDDYAFIATLKEMAASKMPLVELLGIGGTEPLHRLFQTRSPGSYNKVVMIVNQNLGKYIDIEPFQHLTNRI